MTPITITDVAYAYGEEDNADEAFFVAWVNASVTVNGRRFRAGGFWVDGSPDELDSYELYGIDDANGAQGVSDIVRHLGGEAGEGSYSADEQAVYKAITAALDPRGARSAALTALGFCG